LVLRLLAADCSGGRQLLAACFDGLERPSALELLEFFLDVRFVVRSCAGGDESESVEQGHSSDSHSFSPSPVTVRDCIAERSGNLPGPPANASNLGTQDGGLVHLQLDLYHRTPLFARNGKR
jgi:hypothetical protein